jgi:phosphoribosylanthranilate isomerase
LLGFMRTRVKICGFTQLDNAVAAAKIGIDAIGLVFYRPSPRYVEIAQAAAIARALPAFVSVVALFVDQNQQIIEQVLEQVPVDLIQFHGDESANYCRSFGRPYIKAVAMRANVDLAILAEQYHDASALLLDAFDAKAKGGTGNCFNWQLIPEQCALPIILAGGLQPENAQIAIQQVRPYALDVSSGVESAKGIKDIQKIAALITEVNAGDRSN